LKSKFQNHVLKYNIHPRI